MNKKSIIITIVLAMVLIAIGMFYRYYLPIYECRKQARYLETQAFDSEYPACYYDYFYRKCLEER